MVIDYKQILLKNVMDCMGMGLDDKTGVIEQAIEWTIDDCMNELAKQLEDYVQTEEFSNRWEKVK
ncbi:MAG: hypothetical protein VX566_04700 [Candidatus Thermoplasmatota archaeon]|jgi:hypothetical protein|nr:hypothetical protein [Candidatus Thermoplasmatota archaeon]